MKTSCYVTILCLLTTGLILMTQSLTMAQQPGGAPPGTVLNQGFDTETRTVNPFITPSIFNLDESIYNTTVFTFGEIVLFSYTNGTDLLILNSSGDEVLNVSLDKDEYHVFQGSSGIYRIFGSNSFTALVGDATQNIIHGWYAVDQSGRGVSTLFNTYMMGPWDSQQRERFVIAAYENNTEFTVRNLDNGTLLAAGVLDAGEFHTMVNTPYNTFLQVSASKPVSALSYGDTDYYVPSSNGSFTGNLFLGYSSYIGNWTNSITVTGYYDDTEVVVTNAETGDLITEYTINEGQVVSTGITQPTYWRVEASNPVSAGNIPYAGWTGNYAYKTRAIDSSGFGAGTLFYIPTIASRIDLFSFEDDNEVTIRHLGREIDYPYADTTTVFNGVLNAGEGFMFNSLSGRHVYMVESESNVSVIQSNGGFGAEFMPLSFVQDLPDLAVSSDGIHFSPEQESYDQGDVIEITVDVHNFGPVSAESVQMHVYDGDPDEGIAPLLHEVTIPVIGGDAMVSFSFNYTVPNDPEFRQIVVIADPEELIQESNNANNKASRFIIPNDDLLPPIAVTVDAPGSLGLNEDLDPFPNPFAVTATLLNTGTGAAEDVTLEIVLLDGLSHTSRVSFIEVGTIEVGETYVHSWDILADPDITGLNRFSILVEASNAESKTVNRAVNVPSPLPGGIELLYPFNGEENIPLTPELAWSVSQRAETYDVQVSTSAGFTELLYDITEHTATQFNIMNDLEEATTYYWRVRGVNFKGEGGWTTGSFTTVNLTNIPGEEHPTRFVLAQNYPNPFNPVTQIRYALPENAHVSIAVYTIMGSKVVQLVDEVQSAGWHQIQFDASNLSSGVYLYQLRSNSFVESKRMVLIK